VNAPARPVALRLLRSRRYLLNATERRGLTVRQIAAELGVHRKTVREHMQKLGVDLVTR
jgi:predicted ArsR family transcriptional regulator